MGERTGPLTLYPGYPSASNRPHESVYAYNSSTLVIRPEDMSPGNEVFITTPMLPWTYHKIRFLQTGESNSGTFKLYNLDIRRFGTTGSGGAILHMGQLLEVHSCDFHDNWAGENGGAIASTGFDLTIADHSYFGAIDPSSLGNVAGQNGGAVFFYPNGGTHKLLIQDSSFGERAFFDGGETDGFGGNSAGGSGGAVWARTVDYTEVYNCYFRRNHADLYGGGLYQELGNLVVSSPPMEGTYAEFSLNSAGIAGGGIYAWQCSTVNIQTDAFSNTGGGSPDDIWLQAVWQWFVDTEHYAVGVLTVA